MAGGKNFENHWDQIIYTPHQNNPYIFVNRWRCFLNSIGLFTFQLTLIKTSETGFRIFIKNTEKTSSKGLYLSLFFFSHHEYSFGNWYGVKL